MIDEKQARPHRVIKDLLSSAAGDLLSGVKYGPLRLLKDVFTRFENRLTFEDLGGGGCCGWYCLADALLGDRDRQQDVRQAVADAYAFESCDRDYPFAVPRYTSHGGDQEFLRLKSPVRERLGVDVHSSLLTTLMTWGTGRSSADDPGAPLRIYRKREIMEDPRSDMFGVLKARRCWVLSPSWLYGDALRDSGLVTTWLDQTELILVQAVFGVAAHRTADGSRAS